MAWSPAEVIELVKVVFYGIAIVCVPAATFFTMISAARAKRSEEASLRNANSIKSVSDDLKLLEKNTNSISERNEAIAKKLGITEGIEQERASVLAHATNSQPQVIGHNSPPLPVADDRTAAAAEQTAVAAERSAAATERVADAAEDVPKKNPR